MSVQDFSPDALEKRLNDAVFKLMQTVGSRPGHDRAEPYRTFNTNILKQLTTSLGQLIMEPMEVYWAYDQTLAGAYQKSVHSTARMIDRRYVQKYLDQLTSSTPEVLAREDSTITIAYHEDPLGIPKTIKVSSPQVKEASLWISRQANSPHNRKWWWLQNSSALVLLFYTQLGLTRASSFGRNRWVADQRKELEYEVDRLVHRQDLNSTDRLARVADLMDRLTSAHAPCCVDLVEQLVVWTMQEDFGTGWTERTMDGDSELQGNKYILRILGRLRKVYDRMGSDPTYRVSNDPREGRRRRHQLACVARSFASLVDDSRWLMVEHFPKLEAKTSQQRLMEELPRWARLHRLLRHQARRGKHADHAMHWDEWADALERTLEPLSVYLSDAIEGKQAVRGDGSPLEPVSARHWLSLWFCLQLMSLEHRDQDKRLDELDRCGDNHKHHREALKPTNYVQLQADLAYVLRESIRFACLGHRADYRFQPTTFAASLQGLVLFHATVVIELPLHKQLKRLFKAIGGHHTAAQHLQHVLEVYMAGHFLLRLRLEHAEAEQKTGAVPRESHQRPTVFLSYASEDRERVLELSDWLRANEFDVWLDNKDLEPGNEWKAKIKRVIETVDFFIPVLTKTSARKSGMVQRELKWALEHNDGMFLDDNFIIPVMLEECTPRALLKPFHTVEFHEDDGRRQLLRGLNKGFQHRQLARHGQGRVVKTTEVFARRPNSLIELLVSRAMEAFPESRGLPPSASSIQGVRTAKALFQAFSVAALYHDMGHLLSLRGMQHNKALSRGSRRKSKILRDMRTSFTKATKTYISTSWNDLIEEGQISEDVDRDLESWYRSQLRLGEPDHGLVGAWALHMDSRKNRKLDATVLRQAVRAVLLHNAVTCDIDSAMDPVASLLVLSDEVFEWDPARNLAPAPSEVGRSLHQMAATLPPNEPRDKTITIQGLKVQPNDKYCGVVATIPAGQPDADGITRWPVVLVELQVPERLDLSPLALWLSKAQNLSRIKKLDQWGPTIKLSGTVKLDFHRHKLPTRELLREIVEEHSELGSLGDSLEQWLDQEHIFWVSDDLQLETVVLGPLDGEFHTKDLRHEIKKLEKMASDHLKDLDLHLLSS